MLQWSSSNSEEKWSGGPHRSRAWGLVTEKQVCALPAALTEQETPPTGLSGVSRTPLCAPPAPGVPPRLCRPPPPKRTWSCLLLSRERESRPPSRASGHRPRPPPAPSGPGRTGAEPSRLSTEAAAQQCRPPCAQEGLAGGRAGAGGVVAAGRAGRSDQVATSPLGSQCPPAGDGAPVASSGLRASRHGGGRAGDGPSALTEPVSIEAAPTGTGKAGRPEPSSRELERPGHPAGRAAAASREGRGRRGRRLEPEAEEALRAGSGA